MIESDSSGSSWSKCCMRTMTAYAKRKVPFASWHNEGYVFDNKAKPTFDEEAVGQWINRRSCGSLAATCELDDLRNVQTDRDVPCVLVL